jgi:hypothetical protein
MTWSLPGSKVMLVPGAISTPSTPAMALPTVWCISVFSTPSMAMPAMLTVALERLSISK